MLKKIKTFLRNFVAYHNMYTVVLWFVLPLIIAAICVLISYSMMRDRWDPVYFEDEYLELYSDPRDTILIAADAIMNDDQDLLRELQGVKDPLTVQMRPVLVYIFPYSYYINYQRFLFESPNDWIQIEGGDVRFANFLFADREIHKLIPLTVEQVQGRWVFVPSGPYLYFQTGAWLKLWNVISFIYYIAIILLYTWSFIDKNNQARKAVAQETQDEES